MDLTMRCTLIKKENNSEAIIIIPLLLFLYLLPVSINPILPLYKIDLRESLIRQEQRNIESIMEKVQKYQF